MYIMLQTIYLKKRYVLGTDNMWYEKDTHIMLTNSETEIMLKNTVEGQWLSNGVFERRKDIRTLVAPTQAKKSYSEYAYLLAKKIVEDYERQQSNIIFTSLEECEEEAESFAKNNLEVVSRMLSKDYKTGYKEGIMHYLMFKNKL